MKRSLAVLALCGAFMAPTKAEAALVTLWDYTASTVWTGAVFGNGTGSPHGLGTQVVTDTELSWGGPGSFSPPSGNNVDNRSALVISESPNAGVAVTNGGFAPTNIITHHNNPIHISYDTLVSGTLETVLTLTPNTPPGASPGESPFERAVSFNFTETFNDPGGDCGFESATNCDDIFVVNFEDITDTFLYNGFLYTILLIEASGNLGVLTPAQCAAAGVAAGCVGIVTPENAATDLNFAILITAVEVVPEPTMMVLFGLGLLGAGVIRRRRS